MSGSSLLLDLTNKSNIALFRIEFYGVINLGLASDNLCMEVTISTEAVNSRNGDKMVADALRVKNKTLSIRRCVVRPNFAGEKVLTSDVWDYVDLWIKRDNKNSDALFFWNQAREF